VDHGKCKGKGKQFPKEERKKRHKNSLPPSKKITKRGRGFRVKGRRSLSREKKFLNPI